MLQRIRGVYDYTLYKSTFYFTLPDELMSGEHLT